MDRRGLTRRAVRAAKRSPIRTHEALALVDLAAARTTAEARAVLPDAQPILTDEQRCRAFTWQQRMTS